MGMWDAGQLERLGSHHLEARLAAVGVSEFLEGQEWAKASWSDGCAGRSSWGLLVILSHFFFVDNVLSKVSFLAALLCLPPSSDGLDCQGASTGGEARCSGHHCSFGPPDGPDPGSCGFGLCQIVR